MAVPCNCHSALVANVRPQRMETEAQSYSGSEGWASFNSWNDGDNTTWEGLVYGDAGNGVSGGVEVQYRTSNGTWEPVRLWDEPAGLNPDPDPLPSSWHGGACNGSNIAEHAMRHAMTQGSSCCADGALGCAFMGPGYWGCLAGTCSGASLAFFLQGPERMAPGMQIRMHIGQACV